MKIVSQIFEKFRLISEEAADGTTFIRGKWTVTRFLPQSHLFILFFFQI